MNCKRRDIAIAKLAGGDLSPRRAARLQRHLDGCRRCRSIHQELVQQRAAGLAHVVDPKTSVADSVIERIEEASTPRRRSTHTWQVACGVVAFGLVVALLGVVSRGGQTPVSNTPMQTATSVIETAPETQQFRSTPAQSDVVIRLTTDNPNVAIYWLGSSAGGM